MEEIADIVQLVEGEKAKYVKTHTLAIADNYVIVKTTGDQIIAGTKNFVGSLKANGKEVLTHTGLKKKVISTETGTIQAGKVTFTRYGDIVTCEVNAQVRASGDLTRGLNFAGPIPAEFLPASDHAFYIGSGTVRSGVVKIDVAAKYLKADDTLVKNGWYIGTTVYIAKDLL